MTPGAGPVRRILPGPRRPAVRRVGVPAVLLAGLTVLGAAPAQADGYRYWSFWQQEKGSWSYATQGPSVLRPADGDVLGFRFSVSEDSADAATPRGGAADFEAICGGTDPKPGTKRVALALDFGTAADAPEGESPPKARTACARTAEDASAADALATTAKPLRYSSSALLCAIDGYPESGCGEKVSGSGNDGKNDDGTGNDGKNDTASGQGGTEKDADDDGGGLTPTLGLAAGAAAIVALAAGAVRQSRRRR